MSPGNEAQRLHIPLKTKQGSVGPISPLHLETCDRQQTVPKQASALILDVDLDGRNDFVIGARRSPGPSEVSRLSTPNLTPAPVISGPWRTLTLSNKSAPPDRNELADMNGDERLDAVVGYESISSAGLLAWYEGPVDPMGLRT